METLSDQPAKGHTLTECLWESFLPGRGSLVSLRVDLLPVCVSDKCVGACDGTVLGHSPDSCGCEVWPGWDSGELRVCVVSWTDRPCQCFLRTPSLASCKSGGCLAALICQTRLHKALFRTDPGVMPWHSWSCILGLCRSIPGVTSVHGQYNTETVSRYCCHKELPLPLCVSSFLLSLTSDFNIFKSSQSSLVLISSHFLFPFHRMRRSH